MRLNGLSLIITKAVDELQNPLVSQYAPAITLGAFREDVWYLPILDQVVEHASLTHFSGKKIPGGFFPGIIPSAPTRADHFFKKALHEYKQSSRAAGFVQLGRVAHLLIDMACPVHASRVLHDTDGYEWYVDSHRKELIALPTVPFTHSVSHASEICQSMARFTQKFPTDPTQHALGRVMKRMGVWKGLNREQVATQAREIIPVAIGHTSALLRLFVDQVTQ